MHPIRRPHRAVPAAVLLAAGLLAAPAAAGAADFAAAPQSTRTALPCEPATPCEVHFAVDQMSAPGDVTRLAPGTYDLASGVKVTTGTLAGAGGAERSTLVGRAIYAEGVGSVIRDLDVTAPTTNALTVAGGANATGVRVEGGGSGHHAVYVQGSASTLRNVAAHIAGTGVTAVELSKLGDDPTPQKLLGVTAVAEGPGAVGVRVTANSTSIGGPNCLVSTGLATVRNTIARGTASDVDARTTEPLGCATHSTAKLVVDHSNLSTTSHSTHGSIDLVTGNQTDAYTRTVFADAAMHQLDDGPTVDAGTFDPAGGPLDPDGDAVPSGGTPDIGADELPVAVPVTTGQAVAAADGTVTLRGTVTTGGQPAGVTFDYGPGTTYGERTAPVVVPAGATGTDVAVALPGVRAGQTVHFRARAVVGTAQPRESVGADGVIAVPAPAGTPSGPGGPKGPVMPATILGRVGAPASVTRAKLAEGVTVKLAMRGAGRARVGLTVRRGARTIRLASRTVTVTKAGTVRVRLRAMKQALATLGGRRRVTATLTVRASGAGFSATRRTATVAVRYAPRGVKSPRS